MSDAPPRRGDIDVLGIGNAIVDVVAHAEDALLAELGLIKGAMRLVDRSEVERLYARMGPAHEVSGGSCANSMAAIASLGGRAAFVGRVAADELGRVFAHDIRAAGVTFESPARDGGLPTGRCLVFVTPDAQRTMATFLGAAAELGPEDIPADLVERARVVYLEGYLWDQPAAKQACLRAARWARRNGGEVALTLSDPLCVDRWREELRTLVRDEVDLLFANEAEITSLYQVDRFDDAVQRVRREVAMAVLTRGAKGSVVLARNEVHIIDPEPPRALVDTTGAGDLYAAGFLRAYTAGLDLASCGRLASLCASEILAQWGARPERPLGELWRRVQGGG